MVKFRAKILKNKKTNQHSINIPSHLIKYKHLDYDPEWNYHIEITKEIPIHPNLDLMDEMKEKYFSESGEIINLKKTGLTMLKSPPSFLTYKSKEKTYLEAEREYFTKRLQGEIKVELKEAQFENYMGDPIVKEEYEVLKEFEKEVGSIPKILPSLSSSSHQPKFGYISNNNRIVELIIHNKGLKKLPDSIGQLKFLHKLDLRRNALRRIPDSIGQLFYLQEIFLDENQLLNLPNSLGKLKNLLGLYLNKNKLMDIPQTLTELENLFEIDLSENHIDMEAENLRALLKIWEPTLNYTYIDLYYRRNRPISRENV